MSKTPIIIAKFLSLPDVTGFDIYDKFAYLIKSVDGDSYYLYELLPKEGFITEELGHEVYEIIVKGVTYKDIFDWYGDWVKAD